jgi:hypothetical protein
MNDLSWLLYGAEVLANLGIFLVVVGLSGLLVSCVGTFVGIVLEQDNLKYGEEDKDYKKAIRLRGLATRYAVIFFVITSVAMFLPSKQTMYMIAASEMGEEAIQTPEFAKVRKLVNQHLDDALSGEEDTK